MGELGEFSLSVQLFLRTYRWRSIKSVPWAPLTRPLSESRLALVTSGGLVAPGQEPFDESISAELERVGISTVVIQLLRAAAEKVGPPRALLVSFRHGYPLDAPHQPAKQHAVIEAALRLLEDSISGPPVLEEYSIAKSIRA